MDGLKTSIHNCWVILQIIGTKNKFDIQTFNGLCQYIRQYIRENPEEEIRKLLDEVSPTDIYNNGRFQTIFKIIGIED